MSRAVRKSTTRDSGNGRAGSDQVREDRMQVAGRDRVVRAERRSPRAAPSAARTDTSADSAAHTSASRASCSNGDSNRAPRVARVSVGATTSGAPSTVTVPAGVARTLPAGRSPAVCAFRMPKARRSSSVAAVPGPSRERGEHGPVRHRQRPLHLPVVTHEQGRDELRPCPGRQRLPGAVADQPGGDHRLKVDLERERPRRHRGHQLGLVVPGDAAAQHLGEERVRTEPAAARTLDAAGRRLQARRRLHPSRAPTGWGWRCRS